MKTNLKFNMLVASFCSLTVVALASSIMGSLAWYAYSTRVTISYKGTSVADAELLQIGIVDENEYIDVDDISLEQYELYKEIVLGNKIVWSPAGRGLNSDIIAAYLEDSVYSTNTLSPVTSREYASNSDLTLYGNLFNEYVLNVAKAKTSDYVKIPFVFRIIKQSGGFATNSNIWLTDAVAETQGSENINEAVRVYFESTVAKYVLNPSSEETSAGETKVAGLLDLNNDGYYDYNPSTMQELVYGDYASGAVTYDTTALSDDSALTNVNGVEDTSRRTTFYAKHKKGVYVANISDSDKKVSVYETLATISPAVDASGYFSAGKPVTKTSSNSYGLAFLDATIYLEGWDHSVVDQAINEHFNLGLRFEINKN